ncbi:MAG: T9SS C-terminal target domain-containing protein [Ignavibacteriae bacterium]|nr:MAG: T9SS C-terminal target domain-containing protein [Ignavibacteriota bacterium]
MKTICTLFIFLLCIYNSYSQTPYFNYPIDTIVKDTYFNYRSMVKYDNSGFIHIVNTRQYDVQSNTREIFYRTNKSGIFAATQVTNNSVDDNYITFGFDLQGYIHLGWERRDASNNFQLIYASNRNTSNPFGDTVWITTGGLNKATPYMAVGKGDSLVHFVYYTFVTGQDNAYYRRYNFITGQLGPEVLLGPGEAGSENDIETAVDGFNKLHIAYCTNAGTNSAIKYFTNESGTLTEMPSGVTTYVDYPEMTIDNNNVVHIIYRNANDKRIYEIHKSPGGSFSTPFPITAAGLGNPAYWRAIDTDDNGTLYVTFQNSLSSAPKGFFLVYGSGTTYSNPILVFEDSTASYSTRGSSSVAARGNGQVAIAFDPAGSRGGDVVSDIFMKRGFVTSVGIVSSNETVHDFKLYDNYPNPFNPSTKIKFSVASNVKREMSNVKITVFDVIGREITTLVNEQLKPSTYEVEWNASDYPSGVYFYTLTTESFSETKKMILIK